MYQRSPFRYFRTSPEIIRLAVMMYIRFPLSLCNVEDLLHECGIDVSHETVRFWWNRFGPMLAAEIRQRRVESMRSVIRLVFGENWQVYGVRKIWRQLGREGFGVARCTVVRMMKSMGIQGIVRGKPHKTTMADGGVRAKLVEVD